MILLEATAGAAQPEPWMAIGSALAVLAASGPGGFLVAAIAVIQALYLFRDMKSGKVGDEAADVVQQLKAQGILTTDIAKRLEALEKERADEKKQKELAAAREEGAKAAREEDARGREPTGPHPRSPV